MITLTVRTDKPESEVGMYSGTKQLAYETWSAHRQLAESIHIKINDLLKANGKAYEDIDGIVCFQGPGSFTGLRIGLTVANALAYAYDLPIVASQGEAWITSGVSRLESGENDKQALPFYGAEAHITPPKK